MTENNNKNSFNGKHAVVMGGSVAGLLTARVLADHFEQVTIIEKDCLPEGPETRKGVPQGNHSHGLLMRGQQNIEKLFPGIFDELEEGGATRNDMGADLGWFHYGSWKLRERTGIIGFALSRPFLEYTIRRRLSEFEKVRFLEETAVNGYLTGPGKNTVTGVRISRAGGPEEEIPAQLVVDATGRGTRTPQWLEEMGYPRVQETVVKIDTRYVTRVYRRKPGELKDMRVLMIWPTPPFSKRMAFLFPVEGDRWVATMSSGLKDYPPSDEEGYLEFARNLPVPDFYNVVKEAEPLSPIYTHKIPSSLWRHYERMARFPEGLVVLGDAVCSFNPIYGQGMTLSSIEALALGRSLMQQPEGEIKGLSRKFRKQTAQDVKVPWLLATSEDFRYSATEGKRPFGLGLLNRYTARVHRLSATDGFVLRQFEKVMNMLNSPAILFDPRIIIKALLLPASKVPGSAVEPEREEEMLLTAGRR